MSDQRIIDYLTKELLIEKHVVTYRSLSRELALHVNIAKQELRTFHESRTVESFATYCLVGDVAPPHRSKSSQDDERMDVDETDALECGEAVAETRIVLVAEETVKDTRRQFTTVHGKHVYCLSPSPLRDFSLITGPADKIRKADSAGGPDWAARVGRVVSPYAVPPSATTKGKGKTLATSRPVPGATKSKPAATIPAPVPIGGPKQDVKPKASGKLDFSKAKPKEAVKKEPSTSESAVPSRAKSISTTASSATPNAAKPAADDKQSATKTTRSIKTEDTDEETQLAVKAASKRGTKRKSTAALVSESEDEVSEPPPPKPSVRAHDTSAAKSKGTAKSSALLSDDEAPASKTKTKTPATASVNRTKSRVVLSDDEGDEPPVRKRAPKGKTKGKVAPVQDSEDEEDLKAMMELDDDQVTHASTRPSLPPDTDPEDGPLGGDVDMAEVDEDDALEDDVPKPIKTKKKREKKTVPVGRNGLPKRRIEKTRTLTDDKGFMVTEDYSDYESVDEEAMEPEPAPTKAKSSAKPPPKATAETSSKPPPKPKAPIRSGSSMTMKKNIAASVAKGPAGQKSLNSFFGKGK